MTAHWWRASGAGSGGGVSLFGVRAQTVGALDDALSTLGLPRCGAGDIRWCDVSGVDEMVVARASDTVVWLTPHAGPAVARRVADWLGGAGLVEAATDLDSFPEARSEIEARAMLALTRAASPRAVDLLLAQHDLWASGLRPLTDHAGARDQGLSRLIDPPMVVAIGRPNAGKSTLLNALAGQSIAVATEVAGTTLDHIGAVLELDGLVVRWVDTPGIEDAPSDEHQARAQTEAMRMAGQADLVIRVIDASTDGNGPGEGPNTVSAGHTLTLASKADLAGGVQAVPAWADEACSAMETVSVAAFACAVRRSLVADSWLESEEPWRFWD